LERGWGEVKKQTMATVTKNDKRLEVLKTYKIYIGGQFPRTESGRYYIAVNKKPFGEEAEFIGHCCKLLKEREGVKKVI